MRAALFLPCLLLAAAPAQAQERPSKAVPTLAKAPKLDGVFKDFSSPLTIRPPASVDASASFTARVAWRKETLYVGLEATDDQLSAGDLVTVSLFFPGAGTTAIGNSFRFAFDGKRASTDNNTSAFAQERVEAGVQRQEDKLGLEIALPVSAFPRFPAIDPLIFDLCITYEDRDSGDKSSSLSNCKDGGMIGDALKLPEEFRKGLKLKPPEGVDVIAFEALRGGWVGWGVLHYPTWVEAEQPLNSESLRKLVASEPVDPEKADLNVPDSLILPGGRTILTVVSGKNPYAVEGKCDADVELRLGLFLVTGKGRTAQRALEWPAATCALGRALSVSMDEEGALSIGYSNGTTINFAWSGDHFERTEIGKR
ncbi:MAG TPA: hypothetical protein VF815_17670 [Myxococcaceae bacterium]|jgi:hypothetical protein